MITCYKCSRPLADDSRFCGHCGAPAVSRHEAETLAGATDPQRTEATSQPARSRVSASSSPTRSSFDQARFAPGDLLGQRYRIVALLGRGGMGEVFRAHDLKLGREVALKFLPEEFASDARRLQRFLAEARLALQVTHANICRVYDIGEEQGHHFISMEYVDGDDLASLLRRVGRFPEAKALQVARQLCAGLAAAHDQGVLHRDLKPANVLVDGRGQVKITDFGLAAAIDQGERELGRAGTPAYMAPEQWSRHEVSVQSDLYSLGLVLYELFTGRAAFSGATAADFARLHRESAPESPATWVEDIDPAVEQAILRCLEKDPGDRPRSALAVAAALPGGDPLAAALAAGEIPSPELVARTNATGGLRPAVAAALVAVILVGVALVGRMQRDACLPVAVPLPKEPAVLADRAREILRQVGQTGQPADELSTFEGNQNYLRHLQGSRPGRDAWDVLRRPQPTALLFWYRSSPELVSPLNAATVGGWMIDPPLDRPGMARVALDPRGRLFQLDIVPPESLQTANAGADVDWRPLIEAAGFDAAQLTPVEPGWRPPVLADRQMAWRGTYPDAPETPVRLEAAALRGRVVAFRILEPWTALRGTDSKAGGGGASLPQIVNLIVYVLVVPGAAFLARRNTRLGRGDRRGALRFALYLGAVRFLWYLGAPHSASSQEMTTLISHLAWSSYRVCLIWMFYLAIEPYARRLWPRMMVSWVRLLGGRFRDTLVGRDVLIGVAGGAILATVYGLSQWLPAKLGRAPLVLLGGEWPYEPLRGLRHALVAIAGLHAEQVVGCLIVITLFLAFRFLLRKNWIAVAVTSSVQALLWGLRPEPITIVLTMGVFLIFWFGFLRFGFLPVLIAPSLAAVLNVLPLSFDFTSWQAQPTFLVLALVFGLTLWGVRVATAGQTLGESRAQPARARE